MCFNSLEIACRPFEPIANGKIEVTGLTYASVAHFNCDPGYYITGSAVRSCDTDGEWNGIEGVCKRKHLLRCAYMSSNISMSIVFFRQMYSSTVH